MRYAIRVDGIEAGEEKADAVGEDEVERMVDVDVAGVGSGDVSELCVVVGEDGGEIFNYSHESAIAALPGVVEKYGFERIDIGCLVVIVG